MVDKTAGLPWNNKFKEILEEAKSEQEVIARFLEYGVLCEKELRDYYKNKKQ